MKLRATKDHIIATPVVAETKTSSGFILPDAAKEATQLATVVVIGKAVTETKVGETILYTEYSPQSFKRDGETYLIFKEEDILAVIE